MISDVLIDRGFACTFPTVLMDALSDWLIDQQDPIPTLCLDTLAAPSALPLWLVVLRPVDRVARFVGSFVCIRVVTDDCRLALFKHHARDE